MWAPADEPDRHAGEGSEDAAGAGPAGGDGPGCSCAGGEWNGKYAVAVRSWETHWEDLSTFFEFPPEIRRLIYTNNAIESYNRQLRKVTKNKGVFPTDDSVRKLLYLAHRDIARKWIMPLPNWAMILNQLVVYFQGRIVIR